MLTSPLARHVMYLGRLDPKSFVQQRKTDPKSSSFWCALSSAFRTTKRLLAGCAASITIRAPLPACYCPRTATVAIPLDELGASTFTAHRERPSNTTHVDDVSPSCTRTLNIPSAFASERFAASVACSPSRDTVRVNEPWFFVTCVPKVTEASRGIGPRPLG